MYQISKPSNMTKQNVQDQKLYNLFKHNYNFAKLLQQFQNELNVNKNK